MSTIHVKAAPGLRMPVEGKPHSYLSDRDPVAVTSSHYYRRAIQDGDVLDVTDEVNAAASAAHTAQVAVEGASAAPPKGAAKSKDA